jgi:hypothetical protein
MLLSLAQVTIPKYTSWSKLAQAVTPLSCMWRGTGRTSAQAPTHSLLQSVGFGLSDGRNTGFSLLHRVQTNFGAHSVSSSMGTNNCNPVGKVARAWSNHSPPSENAWS